MIAARLIELALGDRQPRGAGRGGYSAGRVLGPLAPYAAGFVVELVERGYRPRSVSGQLELMAHLSRWLAEQGVEPGGLTPGMAERFLEVRRERGVSLRSWRALDPLVGYLRGLGVVPELAASADTPVAGCWLTIATTCCASGGLRPVRWLTGSASRGCSWPSAPSRWRTRCDGLSTGEVTGFVVAQCGPGGRSGSTAKILTSGLRSLLRYLHLVGLTRSRWRRRCHAQRVGG